MFTVRQNTTGRNCKITTLELYTHQHNLKTASHISNSNTLTQMPSVRHYKDASATSGSIEKRECYIE